MAEKKSIKRIMSTKLGRDLKTHSKLRKFKKAKKNDNYKKARKFLMKLGIKPS